MALSLILRKSICNKLHAYPTFLKYSTTVFKTTCSSAAVSNKSFSDNQKLSILKFNNGILSKPQTRNMSASDHRMIWKLEKLASLALLGLLPATIILAPNQILDHATSVVMVMHIHWGLEAIAQDYLRPIVVGNLVSKAGIIGVYVISAVTLGGLLFFNYTDLGVGAGIRRFWEIDE